MEPKEQAHNLASLCTIIPMGIHDRSLLDISCPAQRWHASAKGEPSFQIENLSNESKPLSMLQSYYIIQEYLSSHPCLV